MMIDDDGDDYVLNFRSSDTVSLQACFCKQCSAYRLYLTVSFKRLSLLQPVNAMLVVCLCRTSIFKVFIKQLR